MLSFLLQFQHPSKTSITPECSSVKATFTNVFNQGYSRVVQILKRRITMAREISEGCNGWWKDAHHNPPTKSGSLYLPRLPSFYWVVVRFKYFLFSPLFWEDSHFDCNIFQRVLKPPTRCFFDGKLTVIQYKHPPWK